MRYFEVKSRRLPNLILFLALLACLGNLPLAAQTPELEKKSLIQGKIEIEIPKGFQELEEEILKFKYPSERRPTLVYSNYDAKTNVAFKYTSNKASQGQVEVYRKVMVESFRKSYPTAKWIGNGLKTINGRQVGYLELVTPALDQDIYNLLFFTDVEGKLLMCTFNCLQKEQKDWQETAHKILNSLKVK